MLLAGLVQLVGCTSPAPSPTPPISHTPTGVAASSQGSKIVDYSYRLDVSSLVAQDWHPGDSLPLKWEALDAYGDAIGPAVPLTLTVTLSGPAASKEEAVQQLRSGNQEAASNVILIDNATSKVPANELRLPDDLLPGMYSLTQTIETASSKEEATTTISVVSKP